MQRPDEQRRADIMRAAAELFAARPYHEVRLDDVAAAARISKGAIYTYFRSKDELYLSLLKESAARMLTEMRALCAPGTAAPEDTIRRVLHAFVRFFVEHPQLARLMRTGQLPPPDAEMVALRSQGIALVADVIRRGIEAGRLQDAHPRWTVELLIGAVAETTAFADAPPDPAVLADHIADVVLHGLVRRS